MNIDELLNLMDETLEEAAVLPFTGGRRMVDVDKVRDIMDDIRRNLPAQIRQAKAIVSDRNDIIDTANKEAETMVQRAEARSRALVDEQEIVKQAQKKASEILSAAQQQARDTRTTVVEYCENVLKTTEDRLVKSASEVKNVRSTLRQKPNAK